MKNEENKQYQLTSNLYMFLLCLVLFSVFLCWGVLLYIYMDEMDVTAGGNKFYMTNGKQHLLTLSNNLISSQSEFL